ncbi:hypothetical protein [Undibacterium umbellatum]|uniref:Uncharacterized protein n=1 Tax=Undibacterium umbellatum TaxID=2762300 RepID=A0ABR6ZA00_9BURK|nr:hypothetical protein [Undibacterium umbellatum]MBC3908012.1 hypothetical protein [Undibacterium umbellatum]
MTALIFETVGDVNSTYAYLCVYQESDKINPFMEISLTEDREILFTIYSFPKNVALTTAQWEEISDKAKIFLPKALANEDAS